MATPLPYGQAVDIGGGRGRLAPAAAASLARIDRQIGHYLDINEAWRSPEQADQNYAAYLAYRAYVNGTGPLAPWAPIALPANASIHCIGYAIDTDEQIVGVLNDHGWFQTVYRDGQLVEPWHFEYDINRDNHRYETAGSGSAAFEEDELNDTQAAQLAQAAEDAAAAKHALFYGGNWKNSDGSNQAVKYGVLPIVIHNQALIAKQAGQLAAIEQVVEQLAVGSGAVLDMEAVAAAAERGAEKALEGLTLKAL